MTVTKKEEMIEVIKAMRDSDLNIGTASRKLFMHRNTLYYKLGKIQRETGIDPKTFDGLVKLLNRYGIT